MPRRLALSIPADVLCRPRPEVAVAGGTGTGPPCSRSFHAEGHDRQNTDVVQRSQPALPLADSRRGAPPEGMQLRAAIVSL